MSRKSHVLAILALLFMALALSGCAGCENNPAGMAISGDGETSVGAPVTLKADLVDKKRNSVGLDSKVGSIAWSVDPQEGATVSADGVFTATVPGTYTVTATYKGPTSGSTWDGAETKEIVVTEAALQRQIGSASPSATPASSGTPVQIFFNGNGGVVDGGGTNPSFTLKETWLITGIKDYHFTFKGSAPGTISLTAADGTTYGPYPCEGLDGQGGVKNAYWQSSPNVELGPGTYTIVDSDQKSFSQNDDSKGVGMAWVFWEKR